MAATASDALLIARRYATAIFSEALAAGSEAAVTADFGVFAQAVHDNADLRAALSNPLVGRDAKAAILAQLAAKADKLTQRSLKVIADGGRAELLPQIAELLKASLTAHRGELVAVVTSARPLTDEVYKQLGQSLANATGKAVSIELKQDPSVLGGLSVQLGSLKLDATLSGALNTMRTQMNASATTN